MVRIDASLVPIDDGVKPFTTPGDVATTRVAFASTVEAPALAEVTVPDAIELTYTPEAAAATFTLTVHEPLAGIVPPASTTLAPPLAAVTTPAPHWVAP